MQYEEAIRRWGLRKLAGNDNNDSNVNPIELDSIVVNVETREGGGCETCACAGKIR